MLSVIYADLFYMMSVSHKPFMLSVMASFISPSFDIANIYLLQYKTTYLNEEVNRTETSLQLVFYEQF